MQYISHIRIYEENFVIPDIWFVIWSDMIKSKLKHNIDWLWHLGHYINRNDVKLESDFLGINDIYEVQTMGSFFNDQIAFSKCPKVKES